MSDVEGGEKKGGYRLEISGTGRAKCKGPKPCSGTQISKGELRFGTIVDMKGNTSFVWRHWGCVTPRIIANMKTKFESASDLDGFDELPEEDQSRIEKAWEDGRVADEDIPDSARKPEAEGDDDEDSGKKKKAAKKAPAKKRAEDEEEEVDGEEEKPKKKAAPRKPAKKADVEEEVEKPAKRVRKKAKAESDADANDADEKPKKKRAPPKKPAKAKSKAKVTTPDDESGEDFGMDMDKVSGGEEEVDDDEKPAKKSKRPASKAKPASKSKPASKKAAPPRSRTKKTKEVVESDAEKDDADSE
ncbi:hypothetical protein M0805_008426 [Coniferiporia weirii]|nr:hypothetical protein M0805_008426 [Coniferiporia weirii]